MSTLSEHTTNQLFRSYLATTLRSMRDRVTTALAGKEAGHYPRLEKLLQDIDAALVTIEATGGEPPMTDVTLPRPVDAAALRRRMERAVEKLIAALDALDLEDEDREDDDPKEDDGTAEPSIGALELMSGGDQRNWTAGANDEREDEHDGAEPCEEGEPSLGSFDRLMNQVHGWRSRDPSGSDAEHDPAERGIADQEALDEIKGGYV